MIDSLPLVIVTEDKRIWFVNGETGELMGNWENPSNVVTFNSSDVFYNDNTARV